MGKRAVFSMAFIVVVASGGIRAVLCESVITLGDPFDLAKVQTDDQRFPSIVVRADGSFVVAWESNGSLGSDPDTSIQIRRFDQNAEPLGDQVQVNTYTAGGQFRPAIAMGRDGRVVVAWTSGIVPGTDTSGVSVQGQILASDGSQIGSQFQVNTYTEGDQGRSAVAILPDDQFVVVWQSEGSSGTDSSGRSIQGQMFEASGVPFGSEFQVNTTTAEHQSDPAVAALTDGSFWVLWTSLVDSGEGFLYATVVGKKFSQAGHVVIDEVEISENEWYEGAFTPAVAVGSDGQALTVWGFYSPSYSAVKSRLIRPNGSMNDPRVLGWVCPDCAPNYSASLGNPEVTAHARGEFVVVWKESSRYALEPPHCLVNGSHLNMYGDDPEPFTAFVQNSYGCSVSVTSDRPVGMADSGKFVVAWAARADSGEDNVYGRVLALSTLHLDGFESGDTSAWTSTVP